MDSGAVVERFGGPIVLLPRATLVDALAGRLSARTVRTDCAATLADPGEEAGRPARVSMPEGDLEADLVVGADGVHSALRGALFPHHPGAVYSGFTTWRMMIPVPGVEFVPGETWGSGRLWGTQPLKDGRLYAYAAAVTPAGGKAPDDEKAELLRLFGDWHRPVPDILAAARPEDVLRHDVHHIAPPLPAYHLGRVALLGDAAHAMPPTLGQGGNQAIEDAVVLAHHADDLARYTDARLARTTALIAKGVQAGRMAMMRNRAAIAVRNAAIAAIARTGPDVLLRSFREVADWRPPQPPYAAAGGAGGEAREQPATGDGREQRE
jgi:2-polyprenyl-6-methoxyphenol hydroxylase-like FAD-dependent oxidoreductase